MTVTRRDRPPLFISSLDPSFESEEQHLAEAHDRAIAARAFVERDVAGRRFKTDEARAKETDRLLEFVERYEADRLATAASCDKTPLSTVEETGAYEVAEKEAEGSVASTGSNLTVDADAGSWP